MAARLGGEIAARVGLPQVLGELGAGMALRLVPVPFVRDLGSDPTLDMLARLGALVLLFDAGLALRVRDVVRVGGAATRVALLGSIASIGLGYGLVALVLPDAAQATRLLLAGGLSATSIGISARVLKDLDKMRTIEARTVLGAAVIDDVLGLVVLSLVTGWASSDRHAGQGGRALVFLVLKTVAFFACAIALGPVIARRVLRAAALLRTRSGLLVVALTFCFVLAWSADAIGLAPIIGAFTAGLVLEEEYWREFVERGERGLEQDVEPLNAFLVPLFFVMLGLRTELSDFTHLGALALAFGLTVAAILGKLVASFGAARGSNRLAVWFGMTPRGEVSLVYASLGAALPLAGGGGPALDHVAYSALVMVVVLTTLATPLGLKWSFARQARNKGSREDGAGQEKT
jgi:Kef-type K+ transport system membrane component KefB